MHMLLRAQATLRGAPSQQLFLQNGLRRYKHGPCSAQEILDDRATREEQIAPAELQGI